MTSLYCSDINLLYHFKRPSSLPLKITMWHGYMKAKSNSSHNIITRAKQSEKSSIFRSPQWVIRDNIKYKIYRNLVFTWSGISVISWVPEMLPNNCIVLKYCSEATDFVLRQDKITREEVEKPNREEKHYHHFHPQLNVTRYKKMFLWRHASVANQTFSNLESWPWMTTHDAEKGINNPRCV